MYDCFNPMPSIPPNPPHQHGPNSPLQSFPICDNCGPIYPMGGEGTECTGPGPGGPRATEKDCTPVPPPIPPVRYVPGINVQEQLCNMAERVNVCINRWNQIQANCYKALDDVVGAAVNNDVYYAPDEVRFMEGYDESAACSYSVIEARSVDRSGKPIFVHLRTAYNNETNSGARESITDVSFVTSAQMVMTAVQATETRWKGTTVFNCNPGASTPDDTVWIAGWTRNGVLRFFSGDVSDCTLRQNRMVNCIGPVFPVLKDGKEFTEVTASMGNEPGSIQAMGWKPNGNKVFFNCSIYDQPGMTPIQVMKVLQGMGCATVVITSYQTQAVSQWDATPIAGTESAITYADGQGSDIIGVPGMTGGMTFLGRLTAAPLQWSIPQNCAAWVITKRPMRGWHNAFTTEVANVVQRLGNQENSMNSILGQLNGENQAISKLQYDVQQNTNNISELKVTVDGFDGRISAAEEDLEKAEADIAANEASIAQLRTELDSEVSTRQAQYNELKQADAQERSERQAADASLQSAISAETAARKSADTVLQNNIDKEASDRQAADAALSAEIDTERKVRAQADQNLTAALEAEISARQTKDAQHEAQMEALQAQEEKDHAAQQEQISKIIDGSALPIASETQLGVVKIGKNLTINDEGVLDAQAGGGSGGDSVVEGPGIKVTENAEGQKVISIDENVVVNEDELAAVETKVTALEEGQTKQDENLNNFEKTVTIAIESVAGEIDKLKDQQKRNTSNIENNTTNISQINTELEGIKDGSGLPVASAQTLGAVKIGANLSISEDGTLSASAGGESAGETIAQGAGIAVTHDAETNVATVALNADTQASLASIEEKADKTDVAELESTVAGLQTTVAGKADKTALEAVSAKADKNETDIATLTSTVESVETTANIASAGVSALNSNVTALTNTVNTNTQNIDAANTEIGANKDAIEKLQADLESVDSTATAAMDHATDAEEAAAGKVSKTGDTMSGSLNMGGNLVGQTSGLGISKQGTIDATFTGITQSADKSIAAYVDGSFGEISCADPTKQSHAATKAYVDSEVNAAVNTAQEAITAAGTAESKADEALAAANDAQTALAGKVSKAGDYMSGNLNLRGTQLRFIPFNPDNPGIALANGGNNRLIVSSFTEDSESTAPIIGNVATPQAAYDAANKKYVDDAVAAAGGGGDFLPLSGGTMSGNIVMNGNKITSQYSPNIIESDTIVSASSIGKYLGMTPGGNYFSPKNDTTITGKTDSASNHPYEDMTCYRIGNFCLCGLTFTFAGTTSWGINVTASCDLSFVFPSGLTNAYLGMIPFAFVASSVYGQGHSYNENFRVWANVIGAGATIKIRVYAQNLSGTTLSSPVTKFRGGFFGIK